MDQISRVRAPLVEALQRYRNRRKASFHVPGHKAGAAYRTDPGAAPWLGAIGAYDATELPGLDDLHEPEGAIREAQQLAAECFGAEHSFFLVGGSTVGNLAAIHAVCSRGELILMQRNVHKSAIHALMLSGAGAVFIHPIYDHKAELYGGIRAEDAAEALERYPEAKAIFLTSPNYYGMVTEELEKIADLAHARGIPLIVDEAHGAHFGFSDRFPKSALQCGADVVIQSTHKMLPALTMGAMLHVNGGRINIERIQWYLRMLQSSSPSYPIMASLDWARWKLQSEGAALFAPGLEAADRIRAECEAPGRRFGVYPVDDPMKLLLFDRQRQLTGFALSSALADRGIYSEMADERYVVLAAGPATSLEDSAALLEALEQMERTDSAERQENSHNFTNNIQIHSPSISPPIVLEHALQRLQLQSTAAVEIDSSVGAQCAEMVVPYPPGIPLLFPGETITQESVDAFIRIRDGGGSIQGLKDRSLKTIQVWK